jgi:hypothetical protein
MIQRARVLQGIIEGGCTCRQIDLFWARGRGWSGAAQEAKAKGDDHQFLNGTILAALYPKGTLLDLLIDQMPELSSSFVRSVLFISFGLGYALEGRDQRT